MTKIIIAYRIFLLILLTATKCVLTESTSSYKPYNTLAKFEIQTLQYGKIIINTQTHPNQKYDGILFLNFQEEGLILLDYHQEMKKIAQFQDQIKDIVIRDLFIFLNSKGVQLKILRLEGKKTLTQVNEWKPSTGNPIDYFLVSEDENQIFLTSGSQFIILDIKNKFSPIERKKDLINPSFSNFPSLSYCTVWMTKVGSFIFLSNQKGHLNVIQISEDSNSFTFITQLSKFGNNSIQTLLVKSVRIFYSLSRYYGMYIFDVSSLLQQQPNIDQFLQYTSGQPTILNFTGTIQHFLFSPDDKFLFIAVRSVGLWIYDITDNPYQPQLIQRLLSDGVAFKLHFFRGGIATILLSDGDKLRVYQQVQQQQNNSLYHQYNVFNTNSCIGLKPFEDEKWPWFIVNSKDDNFIAVSGGVYGLIIYDISEENIYNPLLVYQQDESTLNNDRYYALLYLEKRDLLVVGQKNKGTVIYDVTNFSNPTLKVQYQTDSNINSHSDYQTNSDQTLLAIASYSCIIILDISNVDDPSKIHLITRYDIPQTNGKQRVISSITFNSVFSYGFYTVREHGIFAFRIESKQVSETPSGNGQLQLSLGMFKSFYSSGAQYVKYDINEEYVYISDGNNGVAIIDVTRPDTPNIIARVQVNGWAVKSYQPSLNRDTLFVNQMEKGQISIVDISDRSNPIKISELQFGDESSFSTVTNRLSSRYYFAFTIDKGFRVCTNNQYIHLLLSFYSKNIDSLNFTPKIDQVQRNPLNSQSEGDNMYNQKNLSYETNLNIKEIYIQDEFHINLSPLYYSYDLRLNGISFYKNFQISPTPSWISFDSRDMHIVITPSYKELPQDQDTITLLLTVQSQLSPNHLISNRVTYQDAVNLMSGLVINTFLKIFSLIFLQMLVQIICQQVMSQYLTLPV